MAYNYNQGSSTPNSSFDQQGSAPGRTLWMGELESWMDESYLRQLFWSLGEEVTVRASVDKYGGAYAFIEFQSHEGANKILQSVNGTLIPNTSKYFRLNWSSRDGNGNPMPVNNVANNNWNNGFCIFVGDLGTEVDDTLLMQGFLRYPSVRSAKVMMDTVTGNSRGFGFVKFLNEADQLSAIDEMQNVYIGSRPVRISMARPRNRFEAANVPENEITTVFVGCLNNTITEEELRAFFGTCGEILAIKMITNKNIAFIQYERRSSAERAIAELNGAHLGGAKLRLSFGRTQLNSGMSAGYHYTPPQMPAYTNTPPMQPAYQPPQPQPPVQQIPQPVLPPPDLVEPQASIPVSTQNEQFLASQERDCFQWISATASVGY